MTTTLFDLDAIRLERGAQGGRMNVLAAQATDKDLARFKRCLQPQANGCVLWTGSLMYKGYGQFTLAGKNVRVHRFSYALTRDLADTALLDHLCRNRACVNPAHLEIVTARENLMRSPIAPARLNLAKTHCPKGHPYAGDNLFVRKNGIRECKECGRAEARAYQRKRRAQCR